MPLDKTCENCSGPFRVKPKNASQRFCSKSCMTAYESIHGRKAAQVESLEFHCKECGNLFSYKPSIVKAYRVKFGKNPLYCSIDCSSIGRRKDTMLKHRFTCLQCGKEQSRRRKPEGHIYREQKFCGIECKAAYQRTKALERFEAGNIRRHVKHNGYVWISIPALANHGKKTEMLEHRYVMEQTLGRKLLPEETVHHIDGNRQHNLPNNLELFSSQHGPGQRVVDKVDFAIEILTLYPEFARARGKMLQDVDPVPIA